MLSIIFAALIAAAAASPAGEAIFARGACGPVQRECRAAKMHSSATNYCSSYLGRPGKATVTDTVTSTSTVYSTTVTSYSATVTVTPSCTAPVAGLLKKRGAPSPKPACLAAYTANSQISSACSCLTAGTYPKGYPPGTSHTTTTTTTTITTATTTTTASTVFASPTAPSSFYLVDSPAATASFAQVIGSNSGYIQFSGAAIAEGDTFELDGTDLVVNDAIAAGQIAEQDEGLMYERVYTSDQARINNEGFVKLACNVQAQQQQEASTCTLQCTVNGHDDNYEDPGTGNYWIIGGSDPDDPTDDYNYYNDNIQAFTPYVVPVPGV